MASKSSYRTAIKELMERQFELLVDSHASFLGSLATLEEETDMGDNIIESIMMEHIDEIADDCICELDLDSLPQPEDGKIAIPLSPMARAFVAMCHFLLGETNPNADEIAERIQEAMNKSLQRQLNELAGDCCEEHLCDGCRQTAN